MKTAQKVIAEFDVVNAVNGELRIGSNGARRLEAALNTAGYAIEAKDPSRATMRAQIERLLNALSAFATWADRLEMGSDTSQLISIDTFRRARDIYRAESAAAQTQETRQSGD